VSVSSRLVLLTASRTTRRAARARRRQLERDLACFATPAEQNDLTALLDTLPDSQTQEIRDIMFRQSMSRLTRRWPATGRG
jgi:hypothetical protein